MITLSRLRMASCVLGLLIVPELSWAASLSLNQAVDEALTNSPRIKSAEAGISSAVGGAKQAGAWQNPTLGIQGQNLGGSGIYKQVDNTAQINYGLSQQIEIGGKRDARRNAAEQKLELAKLDAAAARLTVARDVKVAFATAISAQESLRLAEEAFTISQQELKSVSHRVAEAASPLIQQSKAEVSVATARFNVEQAREENTVARNQLATQLGREALTETLDTSDYFKVSEPPVFTEGALEKTPDMLRLHIEEAKAGALFDLEKAGAIPDPTVSLGVQELRKTSDRAFMLGVSIPIPVLNSNSGNISQARADMVRVASDQQQAKLTLLQKFNEAKAALRTSYLKAVSYKNNVLPAAERAFGQARFGYNAGKFQYLEVLDAQRTLFDARIQHVSALRDYHTRRAELERITTAFNASETTGDTHDKE